MFVVPKNLKPYFGAGDLHFITCSRYRHQPRLGSAFRRDLFFTVLEQVRHHCAFVVLGYVLMTEHFHLLVTNRSAAVPLAGRCLRGRFGTVVIVNVLSAFQAHFSQKTREMGHPSLSNRSREAYNEPLRSAY
jgi:REP element-mobilizing transposase RayT